MKSEYYFRANETDFFKWCRHYVRRAIETVESFENGTDNMYGYQIEEDYYEALAIYRQYIVLYGALPPICRDYLDLYLIGNEARPYYKTSAVYDEIYTTWKEVCFPKGGSMVKKVDYFSLGHVLRMIRVKKGLHARQVAELVGISQKTIYDYETGARCISLNALYGMAQIFEISVDELIRLSNTCHKGAVTKL